MPVPDFWLVRRTRSGDPAAFGVLYDRHAPRVYGLLRRLSGDATASEDLTQETFLSAYQSLNAWRGVGAFSSWLCGIAVRHYRNASRRRLPEDELDETEPADSGSDPLARCTALEAKDALEDAIRELPDACREAFVLVYVEEFAYKEAAHLLDVPVGTVQSRLNRAKRLLRASLASLLPDAPDGGTPAPEGVSPHVPCS